MSGVIATLPKFQFSNALGIPMSGGTLTSYLAGTTTLATTYQDEALTTANTNPISLDSRGECTLWLDSTKTYKFVLKNALGVTQWTVDNITNSTAFAAALVAQLRSDLAASGGSALSGYLPVGTGAVARTVQAKLREIVSVKDFGAVGDGVTDDTAAIQAAFNSGASNILIPDGDYVINNSVNPLTLSNVGVTVEGTGKLLFSDYLISGIYVTGANCTLRGFAVEGPGGVDATYVGPTSGILKSFYPGLVALVGVTTVDTPALMNCTVDGMRVINPGVAGISVYKAIGCNVTNNRIESSYPLASLFNKPQFFGIILYTTARHIVSGNTVKGFSQSIAAGGIGASYSFDDYAGTTSSKTRNFTINNNRLEACNDHAIYVTNDAEKYEIGDNYLWAASSTEDGAGGGSLKVEGGLFTVSNNIIRDGIVMRNCYECAISNNYVPIYSPLGSVGASTVKAGLMHEEAAFQRATTNVKIHNNIFKVAGDIETTAGIWFFGRVADGYQSVLGKISIVGNTISGFGKNSGIGYGIIVQQQLLSSGGTVVDIPGKAIQVSNNMIDMASYLGGTGMYGVWLGWALDYCVISNNNIRNVTANGVYCAGVRASIFEGNLIEVLSGVAAPIIGFEERNSDLSIHVTNYKNVYGNNQFSDNISARYYTSHPTTIVKDKLPLLDLGAAAGSQTIQSYTQAENIVWSPTVSGFTLTLGAVASWGVGQTLTIVNKGSQSFDVIHPNGSTTNTISAGSALNYICVGGNVFQTY